jgi:hypothetical protein
MSPAEQLLLYGALVAGFFIAALWRPAVSIAAVLCIYGLKQWGQATSAWLAAHGPFTNYVVGIVVLTALVIRMCRGNCVLCSVRPVTWLVIALYAYSCLSLLWTPRPDLALNMWAAGYPYVLTTVLLAPLAVGDSDDLNRSYSTLLIMGGVLVFALLLFAKWGDRGVLITGTAAELETNPLAIANLGGAVASAAMFLRPRLLPVLSWVIRLVLVAAALALVVKSGSRGQLLATVATLLVMLPIAFRLSNVRGLVPVVIAVSVISFAAQYAAQNYIRRDDDRWRQTDAAQAAGERWRMSRELLQHWEQSPGSILFGLGNSAAFDPRIVGSYPHNVPLETLGEEGLIGFAIYLSINWLALKGLARGMRLSQNDVESRRLLAVVGANFVFSLITTLKEGNMFGSAEFFMAAILLARMPELMSARSRSAVPTAGPDIPAGAVFANIMR